MLIGAISLPELNVAMPVLGHTIWYLYRRAVA